MNDISTNMLKRSDEPEEDSNDASEVVVFGTIAVELNMDTLGNSIN